MTTLTRTTQSTAALAAATALAVAGVATMTMPETTPVPTGEQPGDTTPGLQLTPAAQYNEFCTLVGGVPGEAEQEHCTRIPATLTATSTTSSTNSPGCASAGTG